MRVKMCTHTDGRRMTTINVYRNKVKKSTKTCDVKTSKPTPTPDKFTTNTSSVHQPPRPHSPITAGSDFERSKPQC